MIAIFDYEAGNLTSVKRALDSLGADSLITQDLEAVAGAERVIFPGVGAAGAAVASLTRLGLDKALAEAVERGKPVLGICLGAQIVMQDSEEDLARCLGLLPGNVVRFPLNHEDHNGPLKVPHMGWNGVKWLRPHPIFRGLPPEAEFYFVHSYHPRVAEPACVVGRTGYGYEFDSVIAQGSLVATQFHPEKSGRPGLRVLENFLTWDGNEETGA